MNVQSKETIHFGVKELNISDVQSIVVSIQKEDGHQQEAINCRFQRIRNGNEAVHSFSVGSQENDTMKESLANVLMKSCRINSFKGLLEEVTPQTQVQCSTKGDPSKGETMSHVNTRTSDERICFHCKSFTNYVCQSCKTAWFCNKECQQRGWDLHKESCLHQEKNSTKRKRIYCKMVLEGEPIKKQ